MAFKPKSTGGGEKREFEPYNAVAPKNGNRYARVSLIVDMGKQEREPFEDPKTKELKDQKPCEQVAIFADLVNDVVDYGGNIGKKQYRLSLNNTFAGEFKGINFTTTPPKDADGKLLEGKPWGFHPASLLTKLAKATGKEEIIYDVKGKAESLDISLMLNEPFLCNVEVKKTPDKNGKEDKDGNVIVYTNVNFKSASPVPPGPDDEPMPVVELEAEPMCITFDGATKDQITFIRANLRKQIKLALNYPGSQMQQAIEEWEAENLNSEEAAKAPAPAPAKAPATAPAKKVAAKTTAKKTPPPAGDVPDDDVPFANPYRGIVSYVV